METKHTPKKCVICNQEFEEYGNNPAPIKTCGGSCCNACNATVVIPARIAALKQADEV